MAEGEGNGVGQMSGAGLGGRLKMRGNGGCGNVAGLERKIKTKGGRLFGLSLAKRG
jgi:hypothetical protein